MRWLSQPTFCKWPAARVCHLTKVSLTISLARPWLWATQSGGLLTCGACCRLPRVRKQFAVAARQELGAIAILHRDIEHYRSTCAPVSIRDRLICFHKVSRQSTHPNQ